MRLVVLILLSLSVQFVDAQNQVKLTKGYMPLLNEFDPDSLYKYQSGVYTIAKAMPFPAGVDADVKRFVDEKRKELIHNQYPNLSKNSKRSAIQPQVISGFSGAHISGTPNDNNMAINNDSMVVSVWNTYIRVYNTNGVLKKNWGLEFFPSDPKATKPGNGVGSLNRSYDPKIVFDPASNRFIIVFLEGSESSDTRIIVSFSKTSNPLDGWNVYELTGKPFGGTLWTDYPMIAINGEDLFITVNILKDNTDWKDGFTQSVIWQVPKVDGYSADTLRYNLWSDIKFENKSIWSICPVQDAYQPGEQGLYFLSVRPGDVSNDTVFLHRISNNYSHPNPVYSLKVLKADKAYGVPPSAPQKQSGFMLQTNDARVLGAFYVNNKIQYVQTSRNSVNGRSSVFHGVIQFPASSSPTITANIISYDSLDIAYPTIVHAGNNVFGKQSLITFSHSSEYYLPGTSIVYFDNNGEYSPLLMTKSGEGYINSFIADSSERWGDYTSIQRSYVDYNEFWVVGSFGKSNNTVGTWISKVRMNDPMVSVENLHLNQNAIAFPNPVIDFIHIPFETSLEQEVVVTIFDASGRIIASFTQVLEPGKQKAIINTSLYAQGIYHFSVTSAGNIISNGTFSKQ
ncbi:MAG: T9SS type A sorting domain-containing protein [Bacteroidia bacterium]|nr:T9SS type A sorting domain-containing protein [Bacteroidia bacterium]